MTEKELKLVHKYLNHGTSPEESRMASEILKKHENDESLRTLLHNEWDSTSSVDQSGLDKELIWAVVKKSIGQNAESSFNFSGKTSIRPFLVAASVLIVSGIIFFKWSKGWREPNVVSLEMVYTIKQTGRGEKLNISLPDGSSIKLNSSTKLLIPSNYNSLDERLIYLEGEAFFEVARYERKPFKVITGDITTQVLGTTFNVNANNSQVEVAVINGKVKVGNQKGEIILDQNEMTEVTPDMEKPSKRPFNIEYVTGWKDNILVFSEVSFDEILEKLRQWYGVEFEINGRPTQTGNYSGRFKNKSLDLLLEGLGFSSSFEYRIVNKTVYLNFK